MNREEVIEKISRYLTSQFICDPDNVPDDECVLEAKALLDLCYPCEECGGFGKRDAAPATYKEFGICPSCKGTGKGEPILAIRSESQELPENPHKGDIDIFNNIRLATKQGFDEGIEACINAGFVRVEK